MPSEAVPAHTDHVGDPHGLEALRPGLRLLALRSLGSVDAAEEVAQETLARAVVSITKGHPNDPAKIPAFVAGIARHVIVDALRLRQRAVSLEDVPPGSQSSRAADALDALVESGDRSLVQTALASLPAGDRDLLRLCYYEGLAPSEIAARTGEPADRIRKRKSRALERLRSVLPPNFVVWAEAPAPCTSEGPGK